MPVRPRAKVLRFLPPQGAEVISTPQEAQDAGLARGQGAASVSPPVAISPPVVRVDFTPRCHA
jgi:hypothetical protein